MFAMARVFGAIRTIWQHAVTMGFTGDRPVHLLNQIVEATETQTMMQLLAVIIGLACGTLFAIQAILRIFGWVSVNAFQVHQLTQNLLIRELVLQQCAIHCKRTLQTSIAIRIVSLDILGKKTYVGRNAPLPLHMSVENHYVRIMLSHVQA